MPTNQQKVSRTRFDEAYDKFIVNHEFVENNDYYNHSRERFFRTFRYLERLNLGPGTTTLDIGGGQLGILAKILLNHRAEVGDIVDRAAEDVAAAGLGFTHVNLFSDDMPQGKLFDCVILQEVIEHLQQPPYIVLARIMRLLKPGGVLFMTTPNGFRLRNVIYMLLNREILDRYRYPDGDEPLGHQHEYTMRQMLWQVERAGLELLFAEFYEDGWKGATPAARLGRRLAKPVSLIAHLRNGLVMAARKKAGAAAD